MKNKAILTSLIAGVCCLALAGTVSAATCFTTGVNGTPSAPTKDINIYGASAQQVFWTTEAPNYLQAAGCIPGDGSAANAANWAANSATDAASNPSHFVVRALCGPGHATLVNFRVSSKASYDGPVAVDDSPTVYGDTSCGVLNQRPLLHGGIAACPWGSTACGAPTAARGDCAVVNWGASDVAVGDFQQASYGTPPRNFVANPVTLNTAVDFCHPEAVAFGFYVNNSVVSSSTGTILHNIGSMEARMIFTGSIYDWNQLKSTTIPSQAVVACYRNAGSGTHATLDFMVVRPDAVVNTPIPGEFIFGESTGNMMSCIQSNPGAIGYADADRLLVVPLAGVTGPLTVNGVAPSAAALQNLTYTYTDGSQHAYVTPADAATNMFQDLCNWAGWPARVVNNVWSPTCLMNYIPNNFGSIASWGPNSVNFNAGSCLCN